MGHTKENNFKLKVIDLDDATQVNSGGGTNTQSLQPDAGFIYQVIHFFYNADAPVGDTSGTHRLNIGYNDGANDRNFATIISDHSTSVYTNNSGFVGSSSEQPSNIAQQQLLINGGLLFASNDVPINFQYVNSTDAHQTATRSLKVFVKEYREAP